MKNISTLVISLFLLTLIVGCAYNKKDLPVPEEAPVITGPPITYTNHTKKLFDSYCISCHAPAATQAFFPLTNYTEVSVYTGVGGKIQTRVLNQQNMPPTGSASGQLTTAEKDTLQMWLNQGAPF